MFVGRSNIFAQFLLHSEEAGVHNYNIRKIAGTKPGNVETPS
jgi:hypothetical protein